MNIPTGQLLIAGELREAEGNRRFENVNPATEEVIGTAADATARDAHAAAAAARAAFDDGRWASDHKLRRRCLEQFYDGLIAEREHIRAFLVAETGSPIALTKGSQVDLSIADVSYWASLATDYAYESYLPDRPFGAGTLRRLIRREPIGVVAAITPWNFPLLLNLRKVCSALASGCTVVLKGAPDTPWSATELGRIFVEHTDLPSGVVNVLSSSDHAVGEVLTAHADVDMISFTGSTNTGRRIMTSAASTVKRTCLELGGKSPAILLDDADLASVVTTEATNVCAHAGQACARLTRMLLPQSRYDEGVELATRAIEAVNYGDPLDPKNIQGPLISAQQRNRVLGYIARGRSEAKLVSGGGVPAHLPKGFFVEPTLFVDVPPDSVIAQEEIFGPVLSIIPYRDDAHAVEIANNSMYGLAAAVYGGTTERALDVARALRVGNVDVNGGTWFAPDSPFGGYKQSGSGREGGLFGLEEHFEVKIISYL